MLDNTPIRTRFPYKTKQLVPARVPPSISRVASELLAKSRLAMYREERLRKSRRKDLTDARTLSHDVDVVILSPGHAISRVFQSASFLRARSDSPVFRDIILSPVLIASRAYKTHRGESVESVSSLSVPSNRCLCRSIVVD